MPRTETQKQKRAEKRRQQRGQKRERKAEGTPERIGQEAAVERGVRPEPDVPSAPRSEGEYNLTEVVGAIGQLAGVMTEMRDAVMELAQGQQQLNDRIATVEQAQQQGLDTLATQSGLGMLGLSGQLPGEQAALVQSSSYRAIRETEQQIMSEEGYDLQVPNDGHTIIVGAITEEQVRSRREALQRAINEQHNGGFLR